MWAFLVVACTEDIEQITEDAQVEGGTDDAGGSTSGGSLIEQVFGDNISLDNYLDYESQQVPAYINEDNTRGNDIENEVATLGRVLFYDKNLSSNNTVSCASCHQQAAAFGDTEQVSQGVNSLTARHSMRLVNARFADERRFFWDERAATLEEQTTMPIRDHGEMGFSGTNGDPDFDDLLERLNDLDYLSDLSVMAFGDGEITEERMQTALAQFIRSIQSFDSRYDEGRAQVNSDNADFPNLSAQENLGKRLFMRAPDDGGAGCATCHRPPEFDIDPDSRNNGVTGVFGSASRMDHDVTRSPTLRDLLSPEGSTNGPFMHDGSLTTLAQVVAHYNDIADMPGNDNLDRRLRGRRNEGRRLMLSSDERAAIVAFLGTLTGEDVYSNEMWSDPFIE